MKTKKEIEFIEKSCKIASKILKKCIYNFDFKTEIELYSFLVNEAKKNNCKLAFKPIVAFGKNSAEPHHRTSETKLGNGFLVLDFGVKYKGYCSDMTRTIFLGKINAREKEFYDLVLNVQKECVKRVKGGVKCRDLDIFARELFGEYMKNFKHSLGHGLGKRIHMGPGIWPFAITSRLRVNDIITIEPGLYFKNKFGIRIEDTLLVKKNSYKVLTNLSKDLFIL